MTWHPDILRGEWCDECRAFHGPSDHKPRFAVWCEYHGQTEEDDAVFVRAADAKEAAEEWVSRDYELWGNCVEAVCVRDGDRVRRFAVETEMRPHHRAVEQ